jgi:copper(I)-binding protein
VWVVDDLIVVFVQHLGPGVTIQITAGETAVSLTNTNVGQAAECKGGQGTCGAQSVTIPAGTTATIRTVGTQQNVAATVALHEFVYKSDFEGLRQKMKQLGLKENQATLISALQSVDDKVRCVWA